MADTVLIVEDDQFIREMYGMILRKAGYEVTETPDGAVGLAEVQKGGYSVVLLDLMMPNMDGLTFLKKLEASPAKTPNGPIIVMSNLAYSEAAEEAKQHGASDFFVKADLDPKEVKAIVDKHINLKKKPPTA